MNNIFFLQRRTWQAKDGVSNNSWTNGDPEMRFERSFNNDGIIKHEKTFHEPENRIVKQEIDATVRYKPPAAPLSRNLRNK